VVAAAAYGRAPPLQCLAAYLGATLARIQPVGAFDCSALSPVLVLATDAKALVAAREVHGHGCAALQRAAAGTGDEQMRLCPALRACPRAQAPHSYLSPLNVHTRPCCTGPVCCAHRLAARAHAVADQRSSRT